MKFTKKQLENFKKYEKVRSGGKYNMFDKKAIIATGLTKEEYLFVMNNYMELKNG